jgi:hypothetical protein
MAKNVKETKRTKRTQVKDLPRSEQELSKDEQKKVKGGLGGGEGGWPTFNKATTSKS